MEEKEIWKDIEGFEGMYQVSNMGRVKSLERIVWNNRGYYRTLHEKIRKPVDNGYGYLQVKLHKDGKRKFYLIHRLVAQAFIQFVPQEGVMYDVDHRSTDRTDNRAINLCWVSRSQNMNNPITNSKLSKPVLGIDKVSGLILEFSSLMEAERTLGINSGNICNCLKGKCKSCGGFYWMYSNNNDGDIE